MNECVDRRSRHTCLLDEVLVDPAAKVVPTIPPKQTAVHAQFHHRLTGKQTAVHAQFHHRLTGDQKVSNFFYRN
jgi:uncharacterized alpha/beta hydrolase family protein